MASFLGDLKLSLRLLGRSPGFSLAAITLLGLGIGLNTGMFSVLYALAFSPRPFPEPERVVQLYSHDAKRPEEYRPFSYPVYRAVAERRDLFAGVLAHNMSMVGVAEGDYTRRSFSAVVSANYFEVLGVSPFLGRGFTREEGTPGREAAVVVVSHRYWTRSGSDPGLVGRTIRVNERPFTVVGVAPEGFTGTMTLFGPELYFPLGVFDSLTNDFLGVAKRSLERPDAYKLFVVGRLQAGVSRESAREALAALGKGLEREWPVEQRDQALDLGPLPRISTNTAPAKEGILSTLSVVLLGMTIAVLLVVCLNLAGLLLARGQARRRELAIRLALGGGRAGIVRQLLLEGLLLSLAGGALGMVLATWSANVLVGTLGALAPMTIFFEATVSPVLVGATVFFCGLATLFFALGPALRLSRADLLVDLKRHAGEDAREAKPGRFRPRHPLVVGQVALSLALLIAAGLFLRMAHAAAQAELGFSADDTVVVEVDGSLAGYDEARSRDTYRRVEERLRALPGVRSASVGALVPFGFIQVGRDVRRAGLDPGPDARPATAAEGRAFDAHWNAVGADYFATLGQAVLRGRTFTALEAGGAAAPTVAIVDEALARKLWPEGEALGQRIQFADREGEVKDATGTEAARPSLEIVGVVAATRSDFFEKEPRGALYVPFAQGFVSNAHFHVRPAAETPSAALALVRPVRQELAEAAPGLPVFKVRTFRQHRDASAETWAMQTSATLFSTFGLLALFVAVVGLYGSKAYAVSRRTREIGVRMALGARPGAILGLIVGEGMRTTLGGVVLGLLLGGALGRVLSAVFVDVSAFDPVAFGVAPTLLLLAALVACWLPARRATRIAPMAALRAE